jgi:hypothetical protein
MGFGRRVSSGRRGENRNCIADVCNGDTLVDWGSENLATNDQGCLGPAILNDWRDSTQEVSKVL